MCLVVSHDEISQGRWRQGDWVDGTSAFQGTSAKSWFKSSLSALRQNSSQVVCIKLRSAH